MSKEAIRTRIAPTPSGFLHIGNLFSFVITWLIAKGLNGTVRLRIDDLDAARIRPQYLEDIFKTLDFIGLEPDFGPSGIEDFNKNHSQHLRIELYNQLLNGLVQSGHLFACCCSRKELSTLTAGNFYPGTCRQLGLDLDESSAAWRLALPYDCNISFPDILSGQNREVFLNQGLGDFVVRRKDGIPAYHLASLADDIEYGITLVVRGEDLIISTAAQVQLSRFLGFSTFEKIKWHHHRLLTNKSNKKLSKSAGDTSVQWMIQQGMRRQELLEMISLQIFGRKMQVDDLEVLLGHFQEFFTFRKC